MKGSLLYVSLLICTLSGSSRQIAAQDLAKQKQALDIIKEFAVSLCDSVKDHGKTEAWDVSGNAKAQLSGIVKKIADLGVGAAAKYTSSEYQGILQSDLGRVLDDQTHCRLSVFEELKDKLLPSSPKPDTPSPSKNDGIGNSGSVSKCNNSGSVSAQSGGVAIGVECKND